MNEQPPEQPEPTEGSKPPAWDPDEQVGDIYEVDIGPDGVRSVERLGTAQPRIWVGSLSDYNNGLLYGTWLDAAREPEDIYADIQAMLAASPTAEHTGEPAEEWGIFDYEGFGQVQVGEYAAIPHVAKLARGIADHGSAFPAWASVAEDDGEALDAFEDNYLGHYESADAYVELLIDDLGYERMLDEVPEHLRPYMRIDTAALARDMRLGGDIHVLPADEGGVWIFNGQ